MSEFHITPSPEKVADVVDYDGWHAATERWGYIGTGKLTKLAAEGRRRRKPAARVKPTYRSAYSVYRDWDGPSPDSLTTAAAASALGLTTGTITMGNA